MKMTEVINNVLCLHIFVVFQEQIFKSKTHQVKWIDYMMTAGKGGEMKKNWKCTLIPYDFLVNPDYQYGRNKDFS